MVPVMTVDQAAQELRISPAQVGRLIVTGELDPVPVGDVQLISRSQVERLRDRRREE